MINWWNTSFGESEIASISLAIQNRQISQGEVNLRLEKILADMLGVKFAVTSPNGTTAILLGLHALGVRGGDEVIVPVLTAMGSANGVFGLGARPVFVDSNLNEPNIDAMQIESKITSKTKAILVMHNNGNAVQIDSIRAIADKYGLPVLEDSAQAMFSKHNGKFLGSYFDIGTFSLSVAKIVSTGQGGISVTNSFELYEKMRKLKIQDRDDYDTASFNMKFTDIQAAMLLPQLENIDSRIARMKAIYWKYKQYLSEIAEVKIVGQGDTNEWLPLWTLVCAEQRNSLLDYLKSHDVLPIKWPRPLNEAKWFRDEGFYPAAVAWSSKGLRIPCGPSIQDKEIEIVSNRIRNFYGYKDL